MPRPLVPLAALLALAVTSAAAQEATPGAAGAAAWEALRRPLALPTLPAGAPCPRDAGRKVSPHFGPASGDGPVYPTLGPDAVLGLEGAREEGGWFYAKVLWFATPDYAGPVLVRGRRLDAPGELRFGEGAAPAAELRLTGGGTVAGAPGWRHWPSYTRLWAPGCYAYQVDGDGFSTVVVFQAVQGRPATPAASPSPA